MKKLVNLFCENFSNSAIFLLINLLIIFSASAQDRFPQLRTKLDRVFARVDKNQIPFGTLEENSFGFMNLWQVNTTNTKNISFY